MSERFKKIKQKLEREPASEQKWQREGRASALTGVNQTRKAENDQFAEQLTEEDVNDPETAKKLRQRYHLFNSK